MPGARVAVSGILCARFALVAGVALAGSRGSGLLPLLAGGTGLCLSLLQLRDDLEDERRTAQPLPHEACVLIVWSAAFVALVLCAGLLVGSAASIGGYLHFHERRRVVVSLGVAAAYAAIVWLLLDVALQLVLWPGFVLGALY